MTKIKISLGRIASRAVFRHLKLETVSLPQLGLYGALVGDFLVVVFVWCFFNQVSFIFIIRKTVALKYYVFRGLGKF